jgi:hypothetical protein
MTRASEDWGGPLAIDVAALVVVGLGLWIPSVPGPAQDVASNVTNVHGAMIAASVLIVAMLFLLAYARWLRNAFAGNRFVRVGAVVLAVGALTLVIENALAIIYLAADVASSSGLWDVNNVLSYSAFGLLGIGALVVGRGLEGPGLLRMGSLVTGVLGILAGAAVLLRPLDVLVLPFTLLFLIWLIALGYRSRPTSPE